ncbi:MGDG synthase family glycosyltransferase [Clostridium grantii]|uniref:Processive 1,2-diacylglycerol beta-glucosyltransferase n=1 Tax=Clostridium grantii DSM 8605 TaxID=1121316 RepID=A0A1M5QI04_9CLOT|nr:glycosyltransferase [Clostridium grantii]SHH13501.1 processive 1,2-diacylglycerol beta-glucosyltransferase [Clostridium grantii DSM 8605]
MPRILFISSELTGHGHKSITEAICNKIGVISPDTEIKIIEGFDLAGRLGQVAGKSYIPLTIYAKPVWGVFYKLASLKYDKINNFTSKVIRKKFLDIIYSFKPDMIISVHAAFVGSIVKIIQEESLDIPVVTQIADLISISPLWTDPNAMYTICPTLEAVERVKSYGVPENRIMLFNLPVRDNFCQLKKEKYSSTNEKITFLIMNGCEGNGHVKNTAEILLSNFNCKVIIITGRNEKLKKLLNLTLKSNYKDNIEILGYVNNVEKYMINSDVLIARGSPNVLMEAINCCLPIIVSGTFPGQEKENPEFILNNKLGLYCDNFKNLPSTVNQLIDNNCILLNQIRQNQSNYRDLQVSEKISKFIIDNLEKVI